MVRGTPAGHVRRGSQKSSRHSSLGISAESTNRPGTKTARKTTVTPLLVGLPPKRKHLAWREGFLIPELR